MQRLEVSGAVRPIYGSLGVKRLTEMFKFSILCTTIHSLQCEQKNAQTYNYNTVSSLVV